MDFETLSKYSIESAGALLLVVIAYKIYKLRIVSVSDCCHGAFKFKTVSRGESTHDLELDNVEEPKTNII